MGLFTVGLQGSLHSTVSLPCDWPQSPHTGIGTQVHVTMNCSRAFSQTVMQVFTSGTAVVVCSVGSMTYRSRRRQYQEPGQPGANFHHTLRRQSLLSACATSSLLARPPLMQLPWPPALCEQHARRDQHCARCGCTLALRLCRLGLLHTHGHCVPASVCRAGPVALELYEALTSIQQQRAEDPFGWVMEVV